MGARVLIVGIGNLLLADEGVGVHVARALAERPDPGFDVLDAGTSLLDALLVMAGYDHVVIVDAVRAGGVPGTVYRLEDAARLGEDGEGGRPLSLHQWSVGETLRAAAALGRVPRRLTLVGVEPRTAEIGTELSPEVERATSRVVALLLGEIGRPVASAP